MSTITQPAVAFSVPAPSIAGQGVVSGVPKAILRAEGAIVLAASLAAYARFDGGWAVLALLFLTPDVSMLGYIAGRKVGAFAYNLGHSYVLPAALGATGVLLSLHIASALALIWVAHIGFDRMLGYGLKYATSFGHTHLGTVGTAKPSRGRR
jgi:hypothetical protein